MLLEIYFFKVKKNEYFPRCVYKSDIIGYPHSRVIDILEFD